ncbi:MAG: 16S rRNA (uracil(1498)-N(3))-methyltransferase [Caulobacterales bacterium]
MSEPRLLIDAPLHEAASVVLEEDQARYVGAVMRIGVGQTLRVFNAKDGEWRASVAAVAKRGLTLTVQSQIRTPAPTRDLTLLFSPLKRQATDLVIEKATELGVRRIVPVFTKRTVAETVRLDRLAAIAREAAEQCERLDAPTIAPASPLSEVLSAWDTAVPVLWAAERSDASSIPDVLGQKLPTAAALAVLIGPEGGFDAQEQAALAAFAPVHPISLGPLILRAETAAIAALALVQSAWRSR